MNTIQIQLTEKQYDQMMELLGYGEDWIKLTGEDRVVGNHYPDLTHEIVSSKTYLWSSSNGDIELEIPAEAVESIAVPGDNKLACQAAIEEHGYLQAQLCGWQEEDYDAARAYLEEAGIEDVYDKDNELVQVYILWMACWDIHEEQYQED